MNNFLVIVMTLAVLSVLSARQEPDEQKRAKLESILRLQDSRTVHDGKLLAFLTDRDPEIRERAAGAYGSLQDTTVVYRLVNLLSDKDPPVQYSAAFALGQTAPLLSTESRQTLQYDLIWARLDQMSSESRPGMSSPADDRLIEEMGKFCTGQGIDDLLLRFATGTSSVHSLALVMSIARSAIRGVVTEDGVKYLLRFVRPPEAAPWQVVYALQRVGDHRLIRDELEAIVLLYKHDDARVRMHLATLLGKVHTGETSIGALLKLAEFDTDWRVRVNALKALSSFDLQDRGEVLEMFRRAFLSGNTYIALTALSAFGNSSLAGKKESGSGKEAMDLLRRMAANSDRQYLWQLQAEAALALARLRGSDALSALPERELTPAPLHYQMLLAVGETGDPAVLPRLIASTSSDKPMFARGALEGLLALSRKNPGNKSIIDATYDVSIGVLRYRDMAVRTTAAGLLGDTLFLRSSSVPFLVEVLSELRIPEDIEAIQEAASSLGKLKDRRAIEPLEKLLQESDRSAAMAALAALREITGEDYSARLRKSFEPILTDYDFRYLRGLPDTVQVRLETIRGNIDMDLYKNQAPFTVMSLLKLASERGFYRGLPFHRVVPNFVIQGGDPRGDGWGGPGFTIRSEFVPLTYETGSVGIASAGKDTEGSQFFITQSPQPHLDGRYTLFGKVTSGMDVVNTIVVDDHMFDLKIIR